MKILYVTNHLELSRKNGGFINDYLNDLLFFGLKELFGPNVVDSTPILNLYKECESKIDSKHFWGGMTSFWLLENDDSERSDIENKIKSNYYDFVIFGSIKKCKSYYDIVSTCYAKNKVILVDGDDDTDIDPLVQFHPYFKREVNTDLPVNPISFSFPSHKFASPIKKKSKYTGTCIPGNASTYVFKKEQDYYDDYQKSFFGITRKKAGWDCMRHYEILGNYCMPYFEDIEQCPPKCLHNFPKDMLIEAKKLRHRFDTNLYFDLMDSLYLYTAENLTTKIVAKRFMEKIS